MLRLLQTGVVDVRQSVWILSGITVAAQLQRIGYVFGQTVSDANFVKACQTISTVLTITR